MELANKNVRHKVFGEGTICELDGNVISVRFASGVKKFIFPDAFKGFLILNDEKSKQYVDKVIGAIDKEMKIKRENEVREAEKRQMLKNLPLHSKSQAVFGFIENKVDEVLDSWTVFTGNYRSGYNRGQPRVPSRLYPNSACLLTYCNDKSKEEDRCIFGVFMVKDDFIGSECTDGIIPAHDKYRVILDDGEREDFKFWKYFDYESEKKHTKWGFVEVKFFANDTMARILNDILTVKHGTGEQSLCEDFLDYYCKLNKIDKKLL